MENNDAKKDSLDTEHYYGDDVRKLILGGGLLMLLTLPFFNSLLPVPIFVSLLAILAITLVAGITNPRQLWAAILNTIVSAISLLIFEYYAADAFIKYSGSSALFFVDQVLALIFFVALYLSTKTLRGMFLAKK